MHIAVTIETGAHRSAETETPMFNKSVAGVLTICASAMLCLTACGDNDIEETAEEVDTDEVAGGAGETSALTGAVALGNTLPAKAPATGSRTIGCNDISPVPEPQKCKSMIGAVTDYYSRNSRGAFQPRYTSGKGDFNFNVDNTASGNTVSLLSQYTSNVGIHEFGHMIGLPHAEGLHAAPGRSKTLYIDTSSPMNNLSRENAYLNAPEYYIKGWLPNSEVALYNGGTKTYTLKQISNFSGNGDSTVIIAPKDVNYFFTVSWPSPEDCHKGDPCFTVHKQMFTRTPQGGVDYYGSSVTTELATESSGKFRVPDVNVTVEILSKKYDANLKVRLSK